MVCNMVQDRVGYIAQEKEKRRSRKEGDGRQTGAGQSRSDQFLARKGTHDNDTAGGALGRLRLRGAGYLGSKQAGADVCMEMCVHASLLPMMGVVAPPPHSVTLPLLTGAGTSRRRFTLPWVRHSGGYGVNGTQE